MDYINLSDQYEEVTTKYNKLSKSSPLYPATKSTMDFIKVDNDSPIQVGNRKFTSGHELIDEEVEVNFDHANVNTSQRIESQNGDILRIKELEEKIYNFEIFLNKKEDEVQSLHLALEKKHLEMIEMERRMGDLNAKLAKINTESKDTENNFIVVLSEELMNERKKVQVLENKLIIAENWAEKIAADYEDLRKESMMAKNSLNIFSQKEKPHVFKTNETLAEINLRKNDEEVSKLKKEKKKYKSEIESLKNEIENLRDFIGRQQFYIENYVNTEENNMIPK